MADNNGSQQKGSIKLALRALRHRNYRLFFFGQGISLIGTWIQQTAVGWLVYRLTGSEFYLGLISFCGQIPVFAGSLIGGDFADRWPRRQIVIITQILSMIQALLLAGLVATDKITIMSIILLSLFIGIVNAFDMPTRQAFVYEMVDTKEDLLNAIALNSLIFNLARQIGPLIAGFLISSVGEATCFFINSISFLAVIYSLVNMKLTNETSTKQNNTVLAGIKDGIKYAFGFVPIRTLVIYVAVMSFISMSYGVLMPVFAKSILQGDSRTLGYLMGSIGLGAFVGAIFLARRKSIQGLEKVVIVAAGICAVGLIGFSLSRNLWLSICLIALTGFGVMVQMAAINTILQVIVDDDKRGRVISLHVTAFIGVAPFGSLLTGLIAKYIGAPNTLLLNGLLSIIVIIIFARKMSHIRRLIHPIYVRKGIIPEVATGLQTATRITTQAKD